MTAEQKGRSSWQGWCQENGSEVIVVEEGVNRRPGKPSCVCVRSGECVFEDLTVKSMPPTNEPVKPTQLGKT